MNKKTRWTIRTLFIIYMLYIAWTIISKQSFYSFLLLNTFLAYIPIELAMHINLKQSKGMFVILFILWLLFYPNAPYVLTDLFHLSKIYPFSSTTGLMIFNLHMWWHFGNLVFAALMCSLFGMWSLTHVTRIMAQRLHKNTPSFKIGITFILIFLSAVGVYVGRFLRLHTIYLFMDPKGVVHQLLAMWNSRMLAFIVMFTLIQLLIWLAMNIYHVTIDDQNN